MSKANTVSRPSTSTMLRIGTIKTPVSIYKIVGDSKKGRQWELADDEGQPWSLAAATKAPSEPEPQPEGDPLGGSAVPAASSSAPIGGAVPPAGEAAGGALGDDATLPEDTEPAKPRKGIRKEDGGFVDLTDQIEEVTERSTLEEMRVLFFLDASHVPRERIIGSYYLGGAGLGEADIADPDTVGPARLLKTLGTVLRSTKRVAVVRFSKRKGQTLGVLVARRDGALLLLELAFAAQVRQPNGKCLAHTKAKVSDEAIAGVFALVDSMAAKRDSLDGVRDARRVMEDELVARAEAGELDEYELVPELDMDEETEQLGALLAQVAKAPA